MPGPMIPAAYPCALGGKLFTPECAQLVMRRHFSRSLLSLLLFASLLGCRGPTELFSFVDRHCFVADWMNDHSCLSCRYCRNNCSQPTLPLHPRTLDLPTGDTQATPEQPGQSAANTEAK